MGRPEREAGLTGVDLDGTTALVTGASRGIGRETALALARLGADVLVHGRDRERGEAVVETLRDLGSDAAFFEAEYTDLDAVEAFADRVRDRVRTLDVLVNNAGAHFDAGELTDTGVERTFHANHLAPFLLTNRLRETLAADGRVVVVSSEVHRRASLDLDDVTRIDEYDGFDAYSRSKLANILFTRELARRLDGPTANACHPGFVPESGLWRNASLPVRLFVGVLSVVPRALTLGRVDTPATATVTPTSLAATDTDTSGAYFRDCKPVDPAPQATDDDLAGRLWDWSADRVEL